MQKRYVLFGAGITGMAAVNYFGKENIVAIIDNAPNKIGTYFEGILVISFEEYLKKYKDLQIIISIYSKHYFSCVEQLKKSGINNYFTAPPVLYGFDTPEKMAEKLVQKKCKQIIFYGHNPISERMIEYIQNHADHKVMIGFAQKIDNNIVKADSQEYKTWTVDNIPDESMLVITTNEVEDHVREKTQGKRTIDIFDIYNDEAVKKDYYHPELSVYQNKHSGKRCFIIGNGPSLRKEDLEILEENGEISFGANGIYHIYPETNWRPTYYVMCDAIGYKTMRNDIAPFADKSFFVADYYYAELEELPEINRYHFINRISADSEIEFSDNAIEGIYSGKTVTYAMMQLACFMGVKEIYLLGVDWTGGKNTGVMRKDFYQKDLPETKDYYYDLVHEEEMAYKSAKKYAINHGINIYNATRGGELEVFERVNFDELFH